MKKANVGWAGLALYVAAYDLWALRTNNETLSSGFWRGLSNKRYRIPILLALMVTTKHLAAPTVLPQVDPFRKASEVLRRKENF